MIESFKDIPGWGGRYRVSDQGAVVSIRWVESRQEYTQRALCPRPVPSGHLRVALCRDGVCQDRSIHSLVLESFVGPRPEGAVVCHWNDIPSDNRLENLRWGTPTDNLNDCVRNGRHASASKEMCKRGHMLAGSNLYQATKQRVCRSCRRARLNVYRGSELSLQVLSDKFYKEYEFLDIQSSQLE